MIQGPYDLAGLQNSNQHDAYLGLLQGYLNYDPAMQGQFTQAVLQTGLANAMPVVCEEPAQPLVEEALAWALADGPGPTELDLLRYAPASRRAVVMRRPAFDYEAQLRALGLVVLSAVVFLIVAHFVRLERREVRPVPACDAHARHRREPRLELRTPLFLFLFLLTMQTGVRIARDAQRDAVRIPMVVVPA